MANVPCQASKCNFADKLMVCAALRSILIQKLFFSIENVFQTPTPEIMSARSTNCGRSIEVKWKWLDFHLEIHLESTIDKTARNLSGLPVFGSSYTFYGLMSNTDYEVSLRAKKRHLDHTYMGAWAKKQVRTLAGICNFKMLLIVIFAACHLFFTNIILSITIRIKQRNSLTSEF